MVFQDAGTAITLHSGWRKSSFIEIKNLLTKNNMETGWNGVIFQTNLMKAILLRAIQRIEEERQLFIRIMKDIER